MKKIIFLFFLPLWGLGSFVSAHASVTVTPLSTDFTNKKVTFRVEYANAVNNRAWIWIDLCPVSGVTPTIFQTAVISAASATGNNVLYASTNTRGFFVTASPATVTATLDNASGKFNWCAYGSDAPPNVTLMNGTYTFKGTPPFILAAADGTTTQTVAGKILPASALTMTPVTLTDQTGYPGIVCPYQGSDLFIDATHLCQPRTSGAQNWEAWIKDTRDNELYRIVLMPDNNWWLAQNVKYAGTGIANSNTGCTPEKCGRLYTGNQMSSTYTGSTGARGYGENKQGICPNNWKLPLMQNFRTLVDAISPTVNYTTNGTFWWGESITVVGRLASPNNPVRNGNDYYGFANKNYTGNADFPADGWRSNASQMSDYGVVVGHASGSYLPHANYFTLCEYPDIDRQVPVRCFRQL